MTYADNPTECLMLLKRIYEDGGAICALANADSGIADQVTALGEEMGWKDPFPTK